MGFNDLRPNVSSEQLALLKNRNFSIHPLATAGHLNTWRLLSLTWQPILIFVFTLALLTATDFRYSGEGAVTVVYYVGLVALFLFPVGALALLLFGVTVAGTNSRARPSAVVYWTWWPFWKLVLCAVAAWIGSSIGNHVWHNKLYPHARMQRLQAYSEIDPRSVSGKRLQDAGVVAFNASAGVDRMRAGCLKNGATYCVAPIVFGGELAPDSSKTQDFFMVGKDCCSCPGEFRCGDWNIPKPPGGLRVFDAGKRDLFKLAAEEWAATHGRSLGRPIFFEWVADPVTAYNDLRTRGLQLEMLSLVVIPLAIVLVTVALNGILELLIHANLVAPIETPLPPPGLGQALSAHVLPHMHRHYNLQREEQDAMHASGAKYVML